MKNTKAYLNFHYIILTVMGLVLTDALLESSRQNLMFTIAFLIPVGIVQLITGIDYSIQKLPDEFTDDWRTYWGMMAVYFAILVFLNQADSTVNLYWFWLNVTPWLIVLYQFTIVYRIYNWKSSRTDDTNNHIHTKS